MNEPIGMREIFNSVAESITRSLKDHFNFSETKDFNGKNHDFMFTPVIKKVL
jgi:hypothetical protein